MNLSRRHLIKAGGASLALPFFPSIAASRKTEKPSKKLVVLYIPNGIVRKGFFPGELEREIPKFVGGFNADKIKKTRMENKPGFYDLDWTPTMMPIKQHAKDITMITGLDRTFQNGQDVHAQGSMAYLTSVSPEQSSSRGWKVPNGRTLDHVIADKTRQQTAYKTLEISCNGFRAPKEPPHFDNISWYGYGKVAPSIKEPKNLYERLFMGDGFRSHVNDVTDLVLEDAKYVSKKLGREDREKFGEFMHMIRNIEVRIAKLEKILKNADINEPKSAVLPRGEYIRLMADLMLTALQMGITNISTFMIGPERWQAPMLYESIWDKPIVHHSMTHNQKGDGWKELMKIDVFHMQQYDYILKRMKSIKEADGSSLLDNSIVTYGAAIGDGATHQFFDLPMILAGGAQGQIKQGRFLRCKSGTLNSNLWLTIAQMMGCEIDSYSDSSGTLELS